MKQTAIEWFFDNLKNHEIQAEHYDLYQKAKEMEKEQIIFSNYNGQSVGKGLDVNIKKFLTHAEQYYNKTYKSKQDETNSNSTNND